MKRKDLMCAVVWADHTGRNGAVDEGEYDKETLLMWLWDYANYYTTEEDEVSPIEELWSLLESNLLDDYKLVIFPAYFKNYNDYKKNGAEDGWCVI